MKHHTPAIRARHLKWRRRRATAYLWGTLSFAAIAALFALGVGAAPKIQAQGPPDLHRATTPAAPATSPPGEIEQIFYFDDVKPWSDPGKEPYVEVQVETTDRPTARTPATRAPSAPVPDQPVTPDPVTPPPPPPVVVAPTPPPPPKDCRDPMVECECDHDPIRDCSGDPRTPIGLPPVAAPGVDDETPTEEDETVDESPTPTEETEAP